MISFSIPIQPVAQSRPKFCIRNNKFFNYVIAYDTKKCRIFKQQVSNFARLYFSKNNIKPFKNGVKIKISFYFKNNSKKLHTHKPDIDNLAKAVFDSLSNIAYLNDSQIVEAHLKKCFSKNPHIKISISEVKK